MSGWASPIWLLHAPMWKIAIFSGCVDALWSVSTDLKLIAEACNQGAHEHQDGKAEENFASCQ
jgi:hypothetical protein